MIISIDENGTIEMLYNESVNVSNIGKVTNIRRASHVEPDQDGKWWADMSPVNGPKLGPYRKKSEALEAEVQWIERNYFMRKGDNDGLRTGR